MKHSGYIEIHPDDLEAIAFETGDTIERDPATDRVYLRTKVSWYTAQLTLKPRAKRGPRPVPRPAVTAPRADVADLPLVGAVLAELVRSAA